MTDLNYTALDRHPLHTLISWPAVVAGAVVAVAVGAMLNFLGVALGAGALNPFDLDRDGAEAFTIGAGIWVAIANTLALFVGGFVASRAAKYADHHRGMLHGLTVWALAFLVALLFASSSAIGGVSSALGNAASNPEASDVADAATGGLAVGDVLRPDGSLQRADGSLVRPDGSVIGTDGRVVPAGQAPAVPPAVQPAAENAADATATVALWAFLTMLLGAVGAVLGGRYGMRRHGWETRANLVERPADLAPKP